MPRKIFECNPESFYHITNRCINKDWFQMPLPTVWKIMQQDLFFMHHSFNIQIYAFILMSNHFHLLAKAPEANLSEAIGYFLKNTSTCIVKSQGRINHLWAKRFSRSEIKDFHHFKNVYKYIYQNPLRANICESIIQYPYSTLQGKLGLQHTLIPFEEDTILFEGNLSENISWLDFKIESGDAADLKSALLRSDFKLPRKKMKPHSLCTRLV